MHPEFVLSDYAAAADFIRSRTQHLPTVGLILGSGLSPLADSIEDAAAISYADIPHFPVSTVEGHTGRLVIGRLGGAVVCAMQGRFHHYEGYTLQQTTFPIRVMHLLGIKTVILTNAAGGLNPAFGVTDLMLIQDHLNLPGMMGLNPLIGPNLEAFGTRFPSMNQAYPRHLRELALAVGQELGMTLRQGVYAFLSGPSFETATEVRFLRAIGADAVGMSTVPEAVIATHAGMEVLGISSITNVGIDELDTEATTTHQEVMESGKLIVPPLTALIMGILKRL
ncbi:MAG: purine-nucleoside phosphorylase [Caldilineaceae bacterium]|nr:purine-nucleoside phosphorylase [Caldilineaceae bacterium]MBP8106047.1 purine-nucleoside phosphorylase [Caldilineaceae bacterium]MBP8121947.1 purine-nucleoside phosphorylase [Caldilineaceae bacterium]MBP9073377.1 purine-nucleoside phosphorylase [Caldilineaceae bacterium]